MTTFPARVLFDTSVNPKKVEIAHVKVILVKIEFVRFFFRNRTWLPLHIRGFDMTVETWKTLYLTFVINFNKYCGKYVSVENEYSYGFPNDLPGLLLDKEVKIEIYLVPSSVFGCDNLSFGVA